jgi:PPK2 family polyphosphate:nucleotide phosphotransferase
MSADAIELAPFRIPEGTPPGLAGRPTRLTDIYRDGKDYEARLGRSAKALHELQNRLYADDRYAVLLVFQAMDAAGKDGAIEHVMRGIDPQGVEVHSFKQPTRHELDHDFLWRSAVRLPERGRIGIFNRSYYEEVLVVRVHPEYLAAQRLPERPGGLEALWRERYQSIRDHEAHLARSGTVILKFHLHLSREEQRERFLARIDDPEKNWKFAAGDVAERAHWDAYQSAYEDAIAATSTAHAPWYVIPADDKKNARLIISAAIVDALQRLDLQYPEVDRAELARFREQLAGEK